MKTKKNKNMVYTPERSIPIGVAIKTEEGEYALKIKKAGKREIEIVPIGKLMSQVIKAAEA